MKYTYVLWSGGLDSTYLIQKLLSEGKNVMAAYVELINNVQKTKMEKSAISKLEPIFRNKFPSNFDYVGVVYRCEIIKNGHLMPLIQMPAWISAIITTTPNMDIEKVAIGYVMNDCAISYLEEFKSIIKSFSKISDKKMPKIIFPLSKINKDMIYSAIWPELRGYVVSCENPQGENFSQCGTCVPCLRNPMILESKLISSKKEFVEVINPIQTEMSFVNEKTVYSPGYGPGPCFMVGSSSTDKINVTL